MRLIPTTSTRTCSSSRQCSPARSRSYRLRKRVHPGGWQPAARRARGALRAIAGRAARVTRWRSINDITERRTAELRLTRARDLNAMLSRVNFRRGARRGRAQPARRHLPHRGRERLLRLRARATCGVAGADLADAGGYTGDVRKGLRRRDQALDDPCAIAISNGKRRGVERPHRRHRTRPLRASALDHGLRSVASEPAAARRHGRGVAVPLCTSPDSSSRTCALRSTRSPAACLSDWIPSRSPGRRAEPRARRESYLRLRAIVDASTSAIWLTDREGRCLRGEPVLRGVAAETLADLLGRSREEVLPPGVREAGRGHVIAEVLETGEAVSVERRSRTRTAIGPCFPSAFRCAMRPDTS